MNTLLELTQESLPVPVRLRIAGGKLKEYVLIVTKQGGLVLNKKIETISHN